MALCRTFPAWFCACAFIIGCSQTQQVIPPANLLTANTFDQCLNILREGLHSDEFWPSIHASEALTDAGYGFEVVPILQNKLETEQDDVYRAHIAKVLLRNRRQNAIVILQDILMTTNEAAQLEALKSMFYEASVADTAIIGNLIRNTEKQELKVYGWALLHITEKEKTSGLIRSSLSDPDPAVRIAATDVIPFITPDKKDTTLLVSNLSRASTDLEMVHLSRALAMMQHIPSRNRVPQFTRLADVSIRSQATYAIAESWLIEHVDVLYFLLEDPSLSVRVRAAQALLILNDSGSLFRFMQAQ